MRIPFPDSYSPERALILAVLEQAIRDILYPNIIPKARRAIEVNSAKQFIFNENYLIDWGDTPLSPASLLELVDLDIKVIRDMLRKKMKSPNKCSHKGILV